MAFDNTTVLVQKVIRRLRMVQGANTQLYAEDVIRDLLQEAYITLRSEMWWDHLTSWYSRDLDGTTGKVTAPFVGAYEGFRDIQGVYLFNSTQPMTIIDQYNNPYRFSGTNARGVEPLGIADDPTGTYLFRVWPLASVNDPTQPIRIRLRCDPANIFTDPSVPIPFDSMALVNYAGFKFFADDSSNPTAVASLERGYQQRLDTLRKQHNEAVIITDPRMNDPYMSTQWSDSPW